MVKGWSFVLGLGIAALWAVACVKGVVPAELSWGDALAAVWCFWIVVGLHPGTHPFVKAANPFALSVLLFALWATGLLLHGPAWQTWWNFSLGCALLIVAYAGELKEGAAEDAEPKAPAPDLPRFFPPRVRPAIKARRNHGSTRRSV